MIELTSPLQAGKLATLSVSRLLLCVYGDSSSEFGVLNARVGSLFLLVTRSRALGSHPAEVLGRTSAASVLVAFGTNHTYLKLLPVDQSLISSPLPRFSFIFGFYRLPLLLLLVF